jgi:hypothetical protein
MERKQVLELALQELERQKAGVDADIEAIQAELKGTGSAVRQTILVPSAGSPKGRKRTPAERKAHAQRMREIWKKRKAAAASKTAPSAASTKTRSMTAARKKALSLKMREVWKKRKAAATKKTK